MKTLAAAPTPPAWLGSLMRRLPVGFPGKARVARALLKTQAATGEFLVMAGPDTRFLVPNVCDSIGLHLFIDGVYEPAEVNWVVEQLAPGDVFVDVGANIGVFTVMASKRVGPAGRVIAIEPSPTMFRYLSENVRVNGLGNVTLCQSALDEVAADDRIFYEAPPEHFGNGALTAEYGGVPVTVSARRLDEVLEDLCVTCVSVLKIDVEGFERRVLKGAERLLRGERPPTVLFEFYEWAERTAGRPGDAQRLLAEWGYRLWALEAARSGGKPLDEIMTHDGGTLVAARVGT